MEIMYTGMEGNHPRPFWALTRIVGFRKLNNGFLQTKTPSSISNGKYSQQFRNTGFGFPIGLDLKALAM